MAYLEPITSLQDPVEETIEDPRGSRLGAVRVFILLLGLLLVGRLWYLQIASGAFYREYADANRFRFTRVEALRGVVYDRNGTLLARNRPSYAAAITPADLPPEPEQVYRRLGRMLGLSSDEIKARLTDGLKRSDRFSPIIVKRNIGDDLALILEERHRELPGVHVVGQSIREYADGPLTAHILGYMGAINAEQFKARKDDKQRQYRGDDWVGQTNLERLFEAQLRGYPGSRQAEVDFAGRDVRTLGQAEPTPGNNLVLTLDFDLQRAIASLLASRLDQYGTASAVVLDPQTGQVLALVHLPGYDGNTFARGITEEELQTLLNDPRHPLLDGAIGSAYPIGSVFQTITAAGALQEGIVRVDQKVDCPSALIIPSRLDPRTGVRFVGSGATGSQDVVSALASSSQTYFYLAGGGDPDGRTSGLGASGLMTYAHELGIGQETGIGIDGEVAGNLVSPQLLKDDFQKDWYQGDSYLLAAGDDYVRATPLQLANAFAAIANGGILYRPQLVLQVVNSTGDVVKSYQSEEIRRVRVAPENLALVREGLRAALQTGQTRNGLSYQGVARNVEVPGLDLAGMASTVEYTGPSGEKLTHGWFVGYGPSSSPRVVVAVFVERGRGPEDAGELAKAILSYYLGH